MPVALDLAALLAALLASRLRDATEPVFYFVAGTASLAAAAASVRELAKDDPDWGGAIGQGSAYGALVGAALLILNAFLLD